MFIDLKKKKTKKTKKLTDDNSKTKSNELLKKDKKDDNCTERRSVGQVNTITANNSHASSKKKKRIRRDDVTVSTKGTKTTAAETAATNDSLGDGEDEDLSHCTGIIDMVKDHDRYRQGLQQHSYYDKQRQSYDDHADDDDPKRYLTSLTETLVQRESTLGRYNHLTAEAYLELGETYVRLASPKASLYSSFSSSGSRTVRARTGPALFTAARICDPHSIHRAVILLRAYHRIQLIMYGTTAPIPISSSSPTNSQSLYKALLRRNFDKDDEADNTGSGQLRFEDVQTALIQSVRFELAGDLKRRFGLKSEASVEYTKAARIEEAAFGRENPDVSFISSTHSQQQKIALL
jgi:hypothetical protein